jgi:transcriptional regulator with XRE-family HTH domain
MKPHTIMIDLREIREANKLSQQEIGDAAGYDRFSILRYECGRRDPGLTTVSNWAQALGYEIVLRPVKRT